MNNKKVLAALSMDLKRIALAYYNNSESTAIIFTREAKKRIKEIDFNHTPKYLINHISYLRKSLISKDHTKVSEDALMCSTILKNYVLTAFDPGSPK